MFTRKSLKAIKIIVSVLVAVFLVASVGCDVWPFTKKNTAIEAKKIKTEADTIFKNIQARTNEFDDFLKKLNKRWYSAKDAQEFSNSISTFKAHNREDEANLEKLSNKLTQLAKIDEKKEFTEFIDAKTKAARSMKAVLVNSQKIVDALSPKISNVALLYAQVDKVEQAQDRYMAAVGAVNQRAFEASYSATVLKNLEKQEANANNGTGEGSGSGSGDGSGGSGNGNEGSSSSNLNSNNPTAIDINELNSNVIDSSEAETNIDSLKDEPSAATNSITVMDSSGSSSSQEDVEPWVYVILENKWPSVFAQEFVAELANNFNKLYQDVYSLHKSLAFQNSRKLVKHLQEVKTDVADYSSSLKSIFDNLKEQERLNDKKNTYNNYINGYTLVKTNYEKYQKDRPVGVSSSSLANTGITFGQEYSAGQVERYKQKVRDLNKLIKEKEAAYNGALMTDYKESSFRFIGSVLALFKMNRGISRSLMHETKSWKRKVTAKYVYLRSEYLAKARRNNYKANEAYAKTKNKIAAN